MRLRPILMTSLAFGFGVLPLAISTGAGAGSQNAIGTGVLGGMIAATVLGIFFVPLFSVGVQACDLVLVLVAHQPEQRARHGIGQCEPMRRAQRLLGRPRLLDQRAVARCPRLVLVIAKERRARGDDLLQRGFGRHDGGIQSRHCQHGPQILRGVPPPQEGLAVERYRDTVELDRALDRITRQRYQPALEGIAEQQQVGGNRIAEQRGGNRGRIDEGGLVRANLLADPGLHRLGREHRIGIAREGRGG
jgi:hypothetical protein